MDDAAAADALDTSGISGARSAGTELVVLGAAFLFAISIGLGWVVARHPAAEPASTLDGRAHPALSGARELRYWSATAVPPPEQRFSAVRPPSPTDDLARWPHDALAGLPDPNVLDPSFAPLRLEDVEAGTAPESAIGQGARLAIGGLDALATRDLGRILATRPVEIELILANVGDADLVVSRVYAGTRAIRAAIDRTALDAGGYPVRPLVLPPGSRSTLTLALDGRRLLERGTQAEHLQVFSNDRAHERFDPSDAFSHETRLRLVFDARSLEDLDRPISSEEVPLESGRPRLWMPDLVRDDAVGDVVDLGQGVSVGHTSIELSVQNIGSGPLVIEGADGPGLVVSIGASSVAPGELSVLTISLGPDERLDRGRWIRRDLTLRTNDGLAPTVELAVVGAWAIDAETPDDGFVPDSNRPRAARGVDRTIARR